MFRRSAFAVLLIATGLQSPSSRAETTTIAQEGKKFSQSEATVKVGDSITYVNKDPVAHDVFSASPGMEFDLRTQHPGESSTIQFDKPGVAEVRCAIHPQMKMTVTVEK